MASSTRNVKLGVCKAFYGGMDLGLTQGGVEVQISTETHRVEVDQHGKTAINDLVQGRTVSAKVPMAETTLRNMVKIMPGAALVSDGAGAKASVTFTANPAAGETITVGDKVFTFAAAKGDSPLTVPLGAHLEATLENFLFHFQLVEIRPDLGGIEAKVDGKTLRFEVRDPGELGNEIEFDATAGTASGASFTGGRAETRARVEVTSGVGIDLLSLSQTLRLHPVARADDDFSDDFILFAAGTGGALNFAYKLDAERIYNVDFNGYPHPVTKKVFALGDLLA